MHGSNTAAAPAANPPQPRDHDALTCSIASTLQVIGEKWTLLILRDAFRGVRRFDDFANDLGIARNLLTDRLNKLVDHQILDKVLYRERPTRYEYRLTDKGRELSPALVAFMHWGDRHLANDEPPVVLIHDRCGHPLDQVFVCWQCDETLSPRQIRSRPGTAAEPVSNAVSENGAGPAAPNPGEHVHL